MGTKSRDRLYGSSVRMAAQCAAEARRDADKPACDAWNKRMLVFKGPARPSPTLEDALNAGRLYLEVTSHRRRMQGNMADTTLRAETLRVDPPRQASSETHHQSSPIIPQLRRFHRVINSDKVFGTQILFDTSSAVICIVSVTASQQSFASENAFEMN
jgi:hypothetical protein